MNSLRLPSTNECSRNRLPGLTPVGANAAKSPPRAPSTTARYSPFSITTVAPSRDTRGRNGFRPLAGLAGASSSGSSSMGRRTTTAGSYGPIGSLTSPSAAGVHAALPLGLASRRPWYASNSPHLVSVSSPRRDRGTSMTASIGSGVKLMATTAPRPR